VTRGASDVELRLPADVAYVGLARLVVTTAARQAGMVPERVEDLKIAVSEATTSAIHAQRRTAPDAPVVLAFGPTDGGRFEVTIADAVERNGGQAGDEDDLGLFLIRDLADDVAFLDGDGTHAQLRFAVGLHAPNDG
jgi:serine/threonine-protein kinase RsbW